MKTKVLLVLVLGIGIGFGVVLGLVILPEKAEADVPRSTLLKPYTPIFQDWVSVTLKSHLSHEQFVVRQKRGKWEITGTFQRSSRETDSAVLEARKGDIRELCEYWKRQGYDIEFNRDIEWTVHWF